MSHSNESSSADAIPVLSDVIVQGDPAQGRDVPELVDILPDEPAFAQPPATEREPKPHAAAQPAAAASQAQTRAQGQAQAQTHAPSASSPAPAAPPTPDYDANLLAERLRGRFASFLTGEGRTLIEARCRDAIQEHNTWLMGQVTREVAMLLETEVAVWIHEAIREELKQRGQG